MLENTNKLLKDFIGVVEFFLETLRLVCYEDLVIWYHWTIFFGVMWKVSKNNLRSIPEIKKEFIGIFVALQFCQKYRNYVTISQEVLKFCTRAINRWMEELSLESATPKSDIVLFTRTAIYIMYDFTSQDTMNDLGVIYITIYQVNNK